MKSVKNDSANTIRLQHNGQFYDIAPGVSELPDDVAIHAQRKLMRQGVRILYPEAAAAPDAPEPKKPAAKKAKPEKVAPESTPETPTATQPDPPATPTEGTTPAKRSPRAKAAKE